MRTIKVRNATILAVLNERKIDFEIRTTKDSAQGFALFVDGVKWLDIDLVGHALRDGGNYDDSKNQALFKIKDIKSNVCL